MVKQLLAISMFIILLNGCNSQTEKMLGTWVGGCNNKIDTIIISKTSNDKEYQINLNGVKRNGKISGNELLVPVVDINIEFYYDDETNKLISKEVTTMCSIQRK